MILSLKDKVITRPKSFTLLTWNVAIVVAVAWIRGLGGLVFGLAGTSAVLYISDSIHFLFV